MAATNIDIVVVPGLRVFQEGFVMISRLISAFRRSSSARRSVGSVSERSTIWCTFVIFIKPGDRVVHSIMGPGKVVDIDRDKAAYVIKFDNIETLRKINFKAKLERG